MKKDEIAIIYEDENVIAVNKPAGLMVHGDGRSDEYTLSDWVLACYPETKDVGEPIPLADGSEIPKHGIVHRLDRETSGVLLIAKNQETFLFLKRQFQDRKIKKVYRAIAYGNIRDDRGTIDAPLGKSKHDFRKWATGAAARGTLREAVTEFKVLARGRGFSYLELYPKTGRTHQIRVHLKSIGHPVLCDKRYTPKKGCALGMTRHALHAYSICFLVRGGEWVVAEAPLPRDFKHALSEMKAGCE